jgi:hypothetical protein
MDAALQVNLLAALVPVVMAVLWYSPFLLGRLWSKLGFATTQKSPTQVALTLVATYIAGYYIARSLGSIVIHQHGLYGMLAGDPDMQDKTSALSITVQGLMDKYGHNYRTFKHGAFHGYNTGLKLVLPIFVVAGLVQSQKICWILVHSVFWIICLAIMGGIVCQYMP